MENFSVLAAYSYKDKPPPASTRTLVSIPYNHKKYHTNIQKYIWYVNKDCIYSVVVFLYPIVVEKDME